MVKTIKDIIKKIKTPTDVIDINWIRDIQYSKFEDFTFGLQIEEIIEEYIITRDISQNIVEFLSSFLKHIKAPQEKKVNKKINFFLRGEYGTGKTHFLTFLSLLLLNDDKIQELFRKNQDVNSSIIHYSMELRKIFKNDLLICPIKLTDFDSDTKLIKIIRYSLQELACKKYNDDEIRLFSIYKTINWIKNETSPEIRNLVLNNLDRHTKNQINEDLNTLEFEELIEIQDKLISTYEEMTKLEFATDMENRSLSEVIKNSSLTEKHKVKHVLIILDELSQWWGSKPEIDLINQLHGIVEDFNSELELNISLIVSYQRRLQSKDYITLKERLQKVWTVEVSEFKDIVPRRCLDQSSLDLREIEAVALSMARKITTNLQIHEQNLNKYIFIDDTIEMRNVKEGVYKYFKMFYPFHPAVFIPEIWGEIGKYSTEMRGGMNIIVKLLKKNQNNNYENLIGPSDVISEILPDIFDENQEFSLFYNTVRNTLDLAENSLGLKILALLFIFKDGLSIEEFNLLFLKNISSDIKSFYDKLIDSNISHLNYESTSKKYLLSFESVINIDTHINNIENLLDYDVVLNYLQFELNKGDYSPYIVNDYGDLIEKFNYSLMQNTFLNSTNLNDYEDLITKDLENNKDFLSNYIDVFYNVANRFIDTSIPDGFTYYFKPKLQNIREFIKNKFKDNIKIIFAYTNDDIGGIEYQNYNLFSIIKLNLIIDILNTVINVSGDKLKTAINPFDDVFAEFHEKYQNEYNLNIINIDRFREPLHKFHQICINNLSKTSAELADRREKIPTIDEDFFLQFRTLFHYYYNGEELETYEAAIDKFERENFPARLLKKKKKFCNTPRINNLLLCLREFDEYKAPNKTQKDTLGFYAKLGFLKKIPGDKYKVELDFDKEYIKPIKKLILDKLNDDPKEIRSVLIDLRHSEYGLNFEYILISILALYAGGFIKIIKATKADPLKVFPKTDSEKNSFCKTINSLNNLSKSGFYIKIGDQIPSKDWDVLLSFLKFLKELNIFPKLNKFTFDSYRSLHNVNIERTIFNLFKELNLSKIQLIRGNIENFNNTIGFEDEILETFTFQEEIETLTNFIKKLILSENLLQITEYLKDFDLTQNEKLGNLLDFFTNKEKFRKLMAIRKLLKQILGK